MISAQVILRDRVARRIHLSVCEYQSYCRLKIFTEDRER